MPKSVPSKFMLVFLVAVALFGLAIVPVLLLNPNLKADTYVYRQPVVGFLFSAICVLGIVAVFYPSKCRLMFQKPTSPFSSKVTSEPTMQLSGHHPNCEQFAANRITLNSRVFCGACSGLLLGAIAGLIGIILFSFSFFDIQAGSLWILAVGSVLMLMGLAQIKTGGYLKLAINALFVVGSLISLVSTDLLGQNLLVDLYMLGLIGFMLWLRILLSEWHNKETCLRCRHC